MTYLCFYLSDKCLLKITSRHASLEEVVATRKLLAQEHNCDYRSIMVSFE